MITVGVLEAGMYELIEGDVVPKMGQNVAHVFVVGRIYLALVGIFGGDYVLSQAPLRLSRTTEPEPDVAVLDRPLGEFLSFGTPPASKARLVVEVSNTTLAADTTVKALLYARAGLPEYWIADVEHRIFLVHREPASTGYQRRVIVSANETLSPLARPDAILRVIDLLPPIPPGV